MHGAREWTNVPGLGTLGKAVTSPKPTVYAIAEYIHERECSTYRTLQRPNHPTSSTNVCRVYGRTYQVGCGCMHVLAYLALQPGQAW